MDSERAKSRGIGKDFRPVRHADIYTSSFPRKWKTGISRNEQRPCIVASSLPDIFLSCRRWLRGNVWNCCSPLLFFNTLRADRSAVNARNIGRPTVSLSLSLPPTDFTPPIKNLKPRRGTYRSNSNNEIELDGWLFQHTVSFHRLIIYRDPARYSGTTIANSPVQLYEFLVFIINPFRAMYPTGISPSPGEITERF